MKNWHYFIDGILHSINRRAVNEKNLKETKTINTKSKGGFVATMNLPFGFDNGITGGSIFHMAELYKIKNWNYNRWDYQNIPKGITQERIENLLFLWGKCLIFKYNEKFFATGFIGKTFNYDYTPKTVKPTPDKPDIPLGKTFGKIRIVGVDCIIIYADTGYIWGKNFFGKLWYCLPYINEIVSNYYQIISNRYLLNQKISVPTETNDTVIDYINEIFKNTEEIVVKFDNMLIKKLSNATGKDKENIITFEDRTDTLWKNYHSHWDELKQLLGMSSNANPTKGAQQITDEVNINNVLSDGINNTELKFRQLGVEDFNKVFDGNWIIELKKEEQQNKEEELNTQEKHKNKRKDNLDDKLK